jgi:hypothetical protein
MERDTLDAWLCGKYAPVSRRAPSQHFFAVGAERRKTAFLLSIHNLLANCELLCFYDAGLKFKRRHFTSILLAKLIRTR